MAGYIGARSVTLNTTVATAQDVTATDTTPEVTIINNTHEDSDLGREGKVIFKGQQSGGEESTLAEIQASHDGTADDEKGDLIFKTNDGNDGASPTERLRISSDSTFTFTSDDAGAGVSPHQVYYRNSASPADNDLLTEIDHRGRNDNSQDVDYASINVKATDVSDGTEDGQYILQTIKAGAVDNRIDVNSTETVFNEDNKDVDFRVESTGNVNMFRIDGGNNIIGIGRNPDSNDGGAGSLQLEGNDGMAMRRPSQTNSFILRPLASGDGMRFTQGGTGDRVTLDSSGNFLIGTNSTSDFNASGYRFNVGNAGYAEFVRTDTSDSSANVYVVRKNNGRVFSFRQVNEVGKIEITTTSTSYTTSSDHRLKENVTDITDGITRVKQLYPKRFNFIADADTTVDGFLAHEAQAVVPEAVTGTHNEVDDDDNPVYQGIDQSKLVPLLTAALQEAIAKIETLETKVAALEAE